MFKSIGESNAVFRFFIAHYPKTHRSTIPTFFCAATASALAGVLGEPSEVWMKREFFGQELDGDFTF
jgi:hypothetical protein